MRIAAALLLLALLPSQAAAQQRIFYGADGRRTGTASTDSAGTTTYRDASGRTVGRSTRPSNGSNR